MKIKNIGIVAILFLASGCNDVAVKPYEIVLNKTPSQVDMAGYTMVDQDGKTTDKPIKAKDRFSEYLYAPSEYVGPQGRERRRFSHLWHIRRENCVLHRQCECG